MHKKHIVHYSKILITIGYYLFVVAPLILSADQVTLQWDANNPAPEGYRIYQRLAGQSYDYDQVAWTGTTTSCTISNLSNGVTYYFVVRAYEGDVESSDSNEVVYSSAEPAGSSDSDGDGINNVVDAFPFDPDEWFDTDDDGIGNNTDQDDDNDGMPDQWEQQYGLNPLVADADLDLDADGTTNLQEYHSGTDPSYDPGNSVPDKPIINAPLDGVLTGLNSDLVVGGYADDDGDAHLQTRYQISLNLDFTDIVFDRTSSSHLALITIPDLILDPDATYFWRAKFIDTRNGQSEWSDASTFTTIDYLAAGDSDANGILDNQEIDVYVDLDGDGTSDLLQAEIVSLNTPDPDNPQVGVKRHSDNAQIIAVQAYGANGLGIATPLPNKMTGIICFKLYLKSGVSAAGITIHLASPVPDQATWYKYDLEDGWYAYPNAVFNAALNSVTLVLEDGGIGDEDGIRNGVIVDPAGLGYSSSQGGGSSDNDSDSSSNGGCFINASLDLLN